MLRRYCVCGGVLAAVSAFCAASHADGIAGARDQEMTFHAAKGSQTWVKMESKAPAETIKGSAHVVQGELTLNPAKLDKATGKFSVPFKNLDLASGPAKAK